MIGSGMFEYWQRNEFFKIGNKKSSKKKKSDQSDSSSNKDNESEPIKPLTNVQLQSAYYFFLIGFGLSIFSIFIEISLFNITS